MSSQANALTSSIGTGEDHAKVITQAAKVIWQYTNSLKYNSTMEYWKETTQVVWDRLVSYEYIA